MVFKHLPNDDINTKYCYLGLVAILGGDVDQAIKDFEGVINILKDKRGLFTSADVKIFRLSDARRESYLK